MHGLSLKEKKKKKGGRVELSLSDLAVDWAALLAPTRHRPAAALSAAGGGCGGGGPPAPPRPPRGLSG